VRGRAMWVAGHVSAELAFMDGLCDEVGSPENDDGANDDKVRDRDYHNSSYRALCHYVRVCVCVVGGILGDKPSSGADSAWRRGRTLQFAPSECYDTVTNRAAQPRLLFEKVN